VRSPGLYPWLANPVTYSEFEEVYRASALFDANRDDRSTAYRLLADLQAPSWRSLSCFAMLTTRLRDRATLRAIPVQPLVG